MTADFTMANMTFNDMKLDKQFGLPADAYNPEVWKHTLETENGVIRNADANDTVKANKAAVLMALANPILVMNGDVRYSKFIISAKKFKCFRKSIISYKCLFCFKITEAL